MSFSLDSSHPSGQRADLYWVEDTLPRKDGAGLYTPSVWYVLYLLVALLSSVWTIWRCSKWRSPPTSSEKDEKDDTEEEEAADEQTNTRDTELSKKDA